MRGWFAGLAICMLVLSLRASAADVPRAGDNKTGDPVPPEPRLKTRPPQEADQQTNPQMPAETMLERARQLSDIRGPGAHPFRLKAAFSFIDDELETFHGTYTEYWESDSKWRKEIVVGLSKKIEIANDRKLWEIESDPVLPEKALRAEFAAELFPMLRDRLEFESVDNVPDRQNPRCVVTKPSVSNKEKSTLCFDQVTGAIVKRIVPQWTRYHLADFACTYGEFKKFGERSFPFEIACRQDGHRQIELHVSELAANFNDTNLFDPPGMGAVELGHCAAAEVPAQPAYTPAPLQPAGIRDRMQPVTLRLIVDKEGKPGNIQVVRPLNKSLDEQAVGVVGRWRFKPATCNGEPMAQRVEFEVAFRSH